MSFSLSSKARLTLHDLPRFEGGTLFDRLACAVCRAGCLPRKELYEAWEVARRVRRRFRGGRVIDLAGGHGLLAHVMLLLDDSSSDAVVVDAAIPRSSAIVHRTLVDEWPRLAGRVTFIERDLSRAALEPGDIVVSSHACGALTDAVIDQAVAARVRLAVLPCCHDASVSDPGPLAGWMDASLAIDAMRAMRLVQQGFHVWTQSIPDAVTPKNRLLMAAPAELH